MDGQEIMEPSMSPGGEPPKGKGGIIKSPDRTKMKAMQFLELENTYKISKTLFTELGMETSPKTSPDKNVDITPSIRHLLLKIDNANLKISCLEDELEAVEFERRRLASELGEKSLELMSATAELQEWKTEALEFRQESRKEALENRQEGNTGYQDSRLWENAVNNLIQTNHQQLFIISGLRDILFGSHNSQCDRNKIVNDSSKLVNDSSTCLSQISPFVDDSLDGDIHIKPNCAKIEENSSRKQESDDLCQTLSQKDYDKSFSGQSIKEMNRNIQKTLETGTNIVTKRAQPSKETILDIGQNKHERVPNNIGYNVISDIHQECPCQSNHQNLAKDCKIQVNMNRQIDDDKDCIKYIKKLKYLYGDFDKKLKLEQSSKLCCDKCNEQEKCKCDQPQNDELGGSVFDAHANILDKPTNYGEQPALKIEKELETNEENVIPNSAVSNLNKIINPHSENNNSARPPLKLDLKQNYNYHPSIMSTPPHFSRATPTTPTPTSALRPSLSLHNLQSKTFTEILVPTIQIKPGHNVGTTNKSPLSPIQISRVNKKNFTNLSMVSLITELEENRNKISMGIPIKANGDITF